MTPGQTGDTRRDAALPPVHTGFDLFVSYARADSRLFFGSKRVDAITELKRVLERHVDRSARPARRFRVFTDVEDFELSESIRSAMKEKLSECRSLLVVCSQGATRSEHVQTEIALYRTLPGKPPPIAAVFGAQATDVAPALFEHDSFAADLAVQPGTTLRDWQRQIEHESHKIVARVWDLPLRQVHDRFAARRKAIRSRIAGAIAASFAAFVAAMTAIAGDYGYHRVYELVLGKEVVAPAGVGFAGLKQTPFLMDDEELLVWDRGLSKPPTLRIATTPGLNAASLTDGRIVVQGVSRVFLMDIYGGPEITVFEAGGGEVLTGLAVSRDNIAIATESGALFVGPIDGPLRAAPRPVVVTGLRFPKLFRETEPLRYGETLAWSPSGKWLASATLDGRLIVLDPADESFLLPAEAQYPVSDDVVWRSTPILYETENTRPIGGLVFGRSDERLIFSVGTLGLWYVDLKTGRVAPLGSCDVPLITMWSPHPDGRLLIGGAGSTSTIEVLDLDQPRFGTPAEARCLRSISVSPKILPRPIFSPDGRLFLVGYFDDAPDVFRRTFRVFGLDLWPPSP